MSKLKWHASPCSIPNVPSSALAVRLSAHRVRKNDLSVPGALLRHTERNGTMPKDPIKQAAEFLRDQVPGTGSSHAHAAVAHALGYKSKKALLDDEWFDHENPNLVVHAELDQNMLVSRVAEMDGDTPLKHVSSQHLMRIIRAGLAPACDGCQEKHLTIRPLGYEEDDPEGWVCANCASDHEDYETCMYCGPEYLYRADQINAAGECPEHAGESARDPEEEDDMESYIEYMTKDQ